MYHYKCKVLNVVDGDTIDVQIDLGFNIIMTERIRLYGIDTPELRSSIIEERTAAKESMARLSQLCQSVDNIKTKLDKRDKYGRILGILYMGNETLSANQILVNEGFAKEYML